MKKLILILSCLFFVIPCHARIIYVDANTPDNNDGSSWAKAYKYLQDALADANTSGDVNEIRVVHGVYTPDSNTAVPSGTGSYYSRFKLISGVAIRGGYAGYGEPDPNARNIELYETILSGDLDGNDVDVNDPCDLLNESTRSDNCGNVVYASGITDANIILDGFTIAGGIGAHSGGGMFVGNSNLTVTNCTFRDNAVQQYGGGMYNGTDNGTGSITLTNCTFKQNAARYGGGMCNNGIDAQPVLSNCTFSGNYSGDDGGGMYNQQSSPLLNGCIFTNNLAEGHGGGMVNIWGEANITHCTFSGNSTGQSGGGVFNNQSMPVLTNCMFSGNIAVGLGGGMSNQYAGPTLTNCTFSGNSAVSRGGLSLYNGNATLTNCIFWDNIPDEIGGSYTITFRYSDIKGGWSGDGVNNIDGDPCFADVDANDFHLKSQAGRWDPNTKTWVQDDVTSPCIDAGDPNSPIGLEPFPNGGRVNMGAYGGTAEASKSYFGGPICEIIVAGDINGDCKVDGKDLAIMALHWLVNNNP